MSNYTTEDANKLTIMLRDLSTLLADHKVLDMYLNRAIEDITDARVFVIDMLKKQEQNND